MFAPSVWSSYKNVSLCRGPGISFWLMATKLELTQDDLGQKAHEVRRGEKELGGWGRRQRRINHKQEML